MNDAPLAFTVYGLPRPQGSKVAYGKGRLADSNAEVLKPWREAVKHAALEARDGRLPMEGPLRLTVAFYLPRPASAPKRVIWPAKKPDVDKLLRAAMDGLTDGGAWGDDAQVVKVVAVKKFAGSGSDQVLDIPGMTVRIEPSEAGY